MINILGILGNTSVLNVIGDHITHMNDGLGAETHAVLESIEGRLKVLHNTALGGPPEAPSADFPEKSCKMGFKSPTLEASLALESPMSDRH